MSEDATPGVVSFLTPTEERRARRGQLYQDRKAARKRRHKEATRAVRAHRAALADAIATEDPASAAAAASLEDAATAATAAAGDFDEALRAAEEAEKREEEKKATEGLDPRKRPALPAKKPKRPAKRAKIVDEDDEEVGEAAEGKDAKEGGDKAADEEGAKAPKKDFGDVLGAILASGTSKKQNDAPAEPAAPESDGSGDDSASGSDDGEEGDDEDDEAPEPAGNPMRSLEAAVNEKLRAEKRAKRAEAEKIRLRRAVRNKAHTKEEAWEAGDEQRLRRTATRGVVRLFNEVAKYQFQAAEEKRATKRASQAKGKAIRSLKNVAPEDVKVGSGPSLLPAAAVMQDKQLKELSKSAFFEMLAKPKAQAALETKAALNRIVEQRKQEQQAKQQDKCGWSALKDDFLMSPTADADADAAADDE
eukprot:m51a1_g2841 hypothetical protein (420) ;mRNA; r:278842-280339